MKQDLIITIFGATGDLTARKILPAINELIKDKKLSQTVKVFALGRKDLHNDSYLEMMKTIYDTNLDHLKPHLNYLKMNILDINTYDHLLKEMSIYQDINTRHLIYLALAPELILNVSKIISQTNLMKKGDINTSIIFEKPFGHDLQSAKNLNKVLRKYFTEKQMYRIDHYLGKEMIQNLVQTKFYNQILNSVWNNQNIKSVSIYLKEETGLLKRANYYDEVGALIDMMQSHILQILSLVAMKEPRDLSSESIRKEKIKVLKKLTFINRSVFLGQYKNYLQEEGVKENSTTETFASVRACVKTKEFRNIPIYLVTGKKLNKKESYIQIKFKETNMQMDFSINGKPNILTIYIDPYDGFSLQLNSKKFGLNNETETLNLSFHHNEDNHLNKVEAYEKLIHDAIYFHKTLFTSWDEILLSWKFTDQLKKVQKDLIIYENERQLMTLLKGCGLYEDL